MSSLTLSFGKGLGTYSVSVQRLRGPLRTLVYLGCLSNEQNIKKLQSVDLIVVNVICLNLPHHRLPSLLVIHR